MTRTLVAAMILVAGALTADDDRYRGRGGYGGGYDYHDDDGYGYAAPAPPPPPSYAAHYRRPPMPRPGYVWVDSCWQFRGGRYAWATGYWAPRPYAGAFWVAPRYRGGRFFVGYWGGGRGGHYDRQRYDRRDHDRGRYGYRR